MRTRAAVRRSAIWFEFCNNERTMSMTWKVLLGYVFSAVGSSMGPLGKVALAFLKRQLKFDDATVPVVNTPDELKDVIEKFINDLIAKYVGDNLVGQLLAKVLASLTDNVIDMIWDRLFAAGHVGEPLTAFGRAVVPGKMMAAGDPLAMAADAELCE